MDDVTLIVALEPDTEDFHLFLALAPERTAIGRAVHEAFTEWHGTPE